MYYGFTPEGQWTLALAKQLASKAKAQDVLNIHEELAKIDHFFNTWVAAALSNHGAL